MNLFRIKTRTGGTTEKINFLSFSVSALLLVSLFSFDVSAIFPGTVAYATTVTSSSSSSGSASSSSSSSSDGSGAVTTSSTSNSNSSTQSGVVITGTGDGVQASGTASGTTGSGSSASGTVANNNQTVASGASTDSNAASSAQASLASTTVPTTTSASSSAASAATSTGSANITPTGVQSTNSSAEAVASALAQATTTSPAGMASSTASSDASASSVAFIIGGSIGTPASSSSNSNANASAAASASTNAATSTPGTGTISVCKMIVDSNNVLKTNATGLPAGNFSISLSNATDTSAFSAQWSLTASAFAPDRSIILSQNDADCVDFVVPLGTYNYSAETVSGSQWSAGKYNDQSSVPVTSVSNFFTYKAAGNNNADGVIELTAAVSQRTLVLLNTFSTTPSVNQKPVITLIGASSTTITVGTNFIDLGATAFDFEDGDITSKIVVTGSVATNTIGTYVLTYNVSDSQGLAADPVTRTVIVTSGGGTTNLPPVITLLGTNPMTITVGTNFVDPGATASDPEDGDITSKIVASSTVSTTTPGTYSITYNVKDSQGLAATQVTRTVIVTTISSCPAPVITSGLSASIKLGSAFSYTVTATNNSTSTLNLSITGLPTGLSFASTTGIISGTPTQAGTFSIVITASTTCGTDSKTLSLAVTTGGSSGGSSGGHSGGGVSLVISNEQVQELIPGVALVRWTTNLPATRQVVYGLTSQTTTGPAPLFGYDSNTITLTLASTTHSMLVFGLQPGSTYYFRPYSTDGSLTALGAELTLVPKTATVSCNYLLEYIKFGAQNNPTEVRKLQIFLRDLMGYSNVPVTGVYDQVTYNAVKEFQTGFRNDILTPWGYDGNTGTGYVYILTKKKVNEIYCEKAFPLNTQQESEIAAYKTFLESLKTQGITVPSTAGSQGQNNVPQGQNATSTTPVPSEEQQNIDINNGEIGVLPTSSTTATSSPSFFTQNFRNVAAALFALPTSPSAGARSLAILLIILIIIYVITLVIDRTNYIGLDEKVRRFRRIMFYMAGLAIAIILAILFNFLTILLPLIIVELGVAITYLVLKVREETAQESN